MKGKQSSENLKNNYCLTVYHLIQAIILFLIYLMEVKFSLLPKSKYLLKKKGNCNFIFYFFYYRPEEYYKAINYLRNSHKSPKIVDSSDIIPDTQNGLNIYLEN